MSEALSPSYLTVDAGGIVNAEFKGVIHAEPGSTVEAEALAGLIKGTQIEDEAISTAKLAADSVTAAKVGAGQIVAEALAAGAVTTEKLAAGAVTAGKIDVTDLSAISADLGTVTAGTIEGLAIVGADIRTANAGARVELNSTEGILGINAANAVKFHFDLATGILHAEGVISAEEGSSIPVKTLAGKIKETQIESGAISTPLLAANSVTAAKIAAGTITAEKLSIFELSAISADLGTVTAGTLEAVTVKGATIKGATIIGNHLQLEASSGTYNKLEWLDEKGIVRESILGTHAGANHELLILTQNMAKNSQASLQLWGSTSTEENGGVAVSGGTETLVVVINAKGESGFLQLPETAKRKINRGSAEGEFPGGVNTIDITVEHKLGAKPVSAVATNSSLGAGLWQVTTDVEKTAAKLKIRFTFDTGFQPAKGTKVTVDWIAMT